MCSIHLCSILFQSVFSIYLSYLLCQCTQGPGPADYAPFAPVIEEPNELKQLPYYKQKHYLCISAPAMPLPPLPPSPGHHPHTSHVHFVLRIVYNPPPSPPSHITLCIVIIIVCTLPTLPTLTQAPVTTRRKAHWSRRTRSLRQTLSSSLRCRGGQAPPRRLAPPPPPPPPPLRLLRGPAAMTQSTAGSSRTSTTCSTSGSRVSALYNTEQEYMQHVRIINNHDFVL